MESDHGKSTHAALQRFLVANGTDRRTAKFLAAILGGHHGRLKAPNDRGLQSGKSISEQHSGIDWDKERDDAARAICDQLEADSKAVSADGDSPGLWWLAGLTSVADWIGSEVHSYDVYMGTLIDTLISILAELGCTVIVLSATLTGRRSYEDS